jgi:guanine deaminase
MEAIKNTAPATTYLSRIYTPLAQGSWVDIRDGALVINEGTISYVGSRTDAISLYPASVIKDYSSYLIVPGFVDCHQHLCHYDWMRLIPNLMEWLAQIYELEARFKDLEYAVSVSRKFFAALIRNGTTTCCVHGPYFAEGTNAAFQVASELGLRVLMGMNSADENIPQALLSSVDKSTEEATHLYRKWNGAADGLLSYCFTIRPAYCASREMLQSVSQAAKQLEARIQCHLSEDAEGQRNILDIFPRCKSDTEVYREVGLLGPRTIMAHGVYLSDTDCAQLAETGTSIIHCPRANLLAGGRQFDLHRARQFNIPLGLGTDLGGSKGLSMFRAMEDAMKVSPDISIHEVFRMATLDGAAALRLADKIGSLEIGKDSDLLVLCPKLVNGERSITSFHIEDLLSSLAFQGDDRDVKLVAVKGERIDK